MDLHTCKGAYGRPDHLCGCKRGRDHTEAQHNADLDADALAEAQAAIERAAALKEAVSVLRSMGRDDLASTVEAAVV